MTFKKYAFGALVVSLMLTVFFITRPYAEFPQDPPNDPHYTGAGTGKDPKDYTPMDFQYHFLSYMPPSFPQATDPENASGMSVDLAWKNYGIGRSDVVIAYVEGGINWHDFGEDGNSGTVPDIADKIFINNGELPPPLYMGIDGKEHAAYIDVNDDGWFNAPDYAYTMKKLYPNATVSGDHNGNGILDAEDLIVQKWDPFVKDNDLYKIKSWDGVDNDNNGYKDDISGWDFYDSQNNPATYDTTYGHANGQMVNAAAITNNGFGEAGFCPKCMLLPVKAGCEALDRTDDLAEAWLFAADAGASIIVSTTADLGYSTFMEEAIDYITRKGIAIVESSNDFNSTDHQGGMFHANVLPGNGLVANNACILDGVDLKDVGMQTKTLRTRSTVTSWGTHNMFSVSTQGGTTSESTPTLGGVLALVKSSADDALGIIPGQPRINGFELVQLLIGASSRIEDPTLPWPGKTGNFNLAYGYGRPNINKAIEAAYAGRIPPVAVIDSPRWYTLVDPTVTQSIPVSGRMSAKRSTGYKWQLQFALGAEPQDNDFKHISGGIGTNSFEGLLGVIDLNEFKDAINEHIKKEFSLSTSKELPTTEQYTATIRLLVWDTENTKNMGENRRSIFIYHDNSWKEPFPKYIGQGGDSQACLADIQGQGRLAIVFGDSDGYVHAIDSKTGVELPGWPATTNPTEVTKQHAGVNPRFEPIVNNLSVGDLDADGNQWVIVTTTTGRTYVFDSNGKLRTGWPQTLDKGVPPFGPDSPRKKLWLTRLATRGAFSSPILMNIDGNPGLEIIQAGWDGHLHVWNAEGSYLPGWPKKVELPVGYPKPNNLQLINDQKITNTPCIADLDGDGDFEIVVRTNYNYTTAPDLQIMYKMHMIAYHHDGSTVKGWPVELDGMAIYYGSAQEFVTEGSGAPVACDVDGDGADEIVVSPMFSHPWLVDGNGKIITQYNSGFNPLPKAADVFDLLTALTSDMPMSFTTTGAFGKFGGGLTFAQTGSGIQGILFTMLTPGGGKWLKNYERVVDAQTGKARTGFPTFFQGLNFIGAPIIADVTGDGKAEIIDAGDSSALHAYTEGGTQAEGFPKFTTGWAIWSPSAGDVDSDGLTELVMLTREGYLMVWNTKGKASANTEWWHNQHDEWNTGRYGTDTRPPGIARELSYDSDNKEISFRAPGDDWYAGKASKYIVEFLPGGISEFAARASSGAWEFISVPEGTTELTIRAVDNTGNISRPASFNMANPKSEEATDGGSSGSSGLCFMNTAMSGGM
jgi:hypothetical protein